jgi:deoxyguanosine kinase
MEKNSPLFIAVEGPIGVGKTSLANCLSAHYSAHLLKEIVYENPFLDKFYEDIPAWSFQTEMFFLTNRFHQLTEIQKEYLDRQMPVVSDYHLSKSLIFGDLTLGAGHLHKFKRIYNILNEDLPKPNALIVLNASLDTVLQRIQKRNRHFEQNIDVDYMKQLIDAYKNFVIELKQSSDIPIIEINGDHFDFVERPEDLQKILGMVDLYLGGNFNEFM